VSVSVTIGQQRGVATFDRETRLMVAILLGAFSYPIEKDHAEKIAGLLGDG
jgi:hypothetical protein